MNNNASQATSPGHGTGTASRHKNPAVGLLSNPHSGRNRSQLQGIESIVANHPGVHHRVTHNADEIPAALQELADRSVGVVAINGGDGTAARILTHLLQDSPFDRLPDVVLLPGGTTNMNVGDVGLRGNLKRAVKRLCRWADDRQRRCEVLQRPVLRVQPGNGGPAVYGMFFGTGAIIQGIEYCHANLHSRGVGNEIGPGLAMARTIWGIVRRDRRFLKPVPVSVSIDSGPASPLQDELLLLVSSLERLFLGMRPYWGTGNGPLHTSMVRDGAGHFLRTLPSLLRGKPGRHATEAAGYRSYNCATVRLELDGAWTLDGELYQAHPSTGPVTITNGGNVAFLRL
jgi:diacylglycerol kinase family enzyme